MDPKTMIAQTYRQLFKYFVLLTICLGNICYAANPEITITSRFTGGSAELTCTIPNLGKRRIIWSKLTEPLPLSVGTTRFIPDKTVRVTSASKDSVTLTLRDVGRYHAGEYQCRASGEENIAQVYSLVIPIEDEESTQLLPTQTQLTAAVGDTVLLPCHVDNLNTRFVLWKNGQNRVMSLRRKIYSGDRRMEIIHDEAYEWSLRIKKLRSSDFGQYTCMVNSRPVLTRTITLTNSAPQPMAPVLNGESQLKSKRTVEEGEDVTLNCDFRANPPAKVYWYLAKKKNGRTEYKEVGQGNDFTLHSVRADHSGRYVCMGKNGVRPHGRGRTRLTVNAIPTTVATTTTTFIPTGPDGPRLYHHEERSGNHRNENHQLKCTAVGWPRPNIYWRYNGRRLVRSYKYKLSEANTGRHSKTSTLEVRFLAPSDYGMYECVASNMHGRAEINVELYETHPN